MRRYSQQALAPLAALVLSACTGAQQAVVEGGCPQVMVVGETSQVTKFRQGAGQDLTDVAATARVADFVGACSPGRGRLNVDLTLKFQVDRGPANSDPRGVYDYFVAIADRSDAILAKKVFPLEVAFAANQPRAEVQEELAQTIPLRAGEGGADYRIYVGFQLTDAELAYNRRRTATR